MHFAHDNFVLIANSFKIAMIISLLPGRDLEWVTAIWERAAEAARTYKRFIALYKAAFDHPAEEREVKMQLCFRKDQHPVWFQRLE